jgi:hypothetical protein
MEGVKKEFEMASKMPSSKSADNPTDPFNSENSKFVEETNTMATEVKQECSALSGFVKNGIVSAI